MRSKNPRLFRGRYSDEPSTRREDSSALGRDPFSSAELVTFFSLALLMAGLQRKDWRGFFDHPPAAIQ